MFLVCRLAGQPLRFTARMHLRFAALGLFLYSTNFILFYNAGHYVVSGLLSVIFSLASLTNIALAVFFLGEPLRLRVALGALLGLAGIVGSLPALADQVGAAKAVAPVTADLPDEPHGALTGVKVSAILARNLPEDCIVCNDSIIAGRRFDGLSECSPPHEFLGVTGGAIGTSIPLAVGAFIACPPRYIMSYVSAGSAFYTLQGLWTQARERLDVVTTVLANRAYAILLGDLRDLEDQRGRPQRHANDEPRRSRSRLGETRKRNGSGGHFCWKLPAPC